MAKNKNPHTDQILETVAHVVAEDQTRAECQDELDDVEGEIERLKDLLEEQKVLKREKSEALKESEQRMIALIAELSMLSSGRPRLPHITPTLPGDSLDPADHHGLAELVRFGLTEKQIEKLADSKLAEEFTLKSIGDFIRAIAKESWWHKKVKGWGESAVDKATSALAMYRDQHPEPDGDDRPKECRKCHENYPQSAKECPICGGTTFDLVGDPPDSDPELSQPSLPVTEEHAPEDCELVEA